MSNKNYNKPIFDPRKKTLEVPIWNRFTRRPNSKRIAVASIRAALLKTRYPTSEYPPDPRCSYCHGVGEVKKGVVFKPCVCLFVRHDSIPAVMAALQEAANTPEEIGKTLEMTGLTEWDEAIAKK